MSEPIRPPELPEPPNAGAEQVKPTADAPAPPPAASAPPPAAPVPAPPPAAPPASAAAPPPPVAPPAAAAVPPLPPAPPPVAAAPQAPAAAPPAVAAAEQAAREAASQVAERTRAWWGRLDPTGKRPTLILAGVLAALVLGTQVVNGVLPAPRGGGAAPTNGGPAVGARPIDVGMGVRIYALASWQQLEVSGPLAGVRLQNGSVVLDVRVTQFGGDHLNLLSAYVSQVLQPDSQQLNVSQVTVVPINGRTAARAGYLGLFNGVSGSVEGELTTFVFANGTGVIVDAWGAQGSLERALPEIHAMVDTIEVR